MMSIAARSKVSLISACRVLYNQHQQPHQQHIIHRYMGHTVRIIVQKDLPNGAGYMNDVLEVKAGYARNYLIPQKYAVYATRTNFNKFNMKDPALETMEEKRARLAAEALASADQDLKASDLLKYYLRNKILKIWRNVSVENPEYLSPGFVDAKAIRDKLSKQLRIDLEKHEVIDIRTEPLSTMKLSHAELTEADIERMLNEDFPPLAVNNDSNNNEISTGKQAITTTTTTTTDSTQQTKEEVEDTSLEASTIAPTTTSDSETETASKEGEDTRLEASTIAPTTTSDNGTETTSAPVTQKLRQQQQQVIRHLGEYLARITLRGGYVVPLKIEVLRR